MYCFGMYFNLQDKQAIHRLLAQANHELPGNVISKKQTPTHEYH